MTEGREFRRPPQLKHGKSNAPEYNVWKKMRDRCRNPKATQYQYYGGKGVTVCARRDDFGAFLADMGPRPSPAHTLDRKDGALGYSPDNCRWATKAEQNANRSNVHRIVLPDGKAVSGAELARQLGIERYRVYRWIKAAPAHHEHAWVRELLEAA